MAAFKIRKRCMASPTCSFRQGVSRLPPKRSWRDTLVAGAFVVAAWLNWAAAAGADEQPSLFAGLSVIAYGEQLLDVATGVTTLPDGGEVIDRDSGVALVGAVIRYREGSFIEAEEAAIETPSGRLQAEKVRIDVEAGVLFAEGTASVALEALSASSERLSLDLREEIIVAQGAVTSVAPSFEAAAVVIDMVASRAFLVGPYRYQDDPVSLRGSGDGDLLMVSWSVSNDEVSFDVATEFEAGVLARIEPYLP